MAKFDATLITRRSIRGIFVLTAMQLVNSILFFFLTLFIDARTLGVYFVVSAALAFLVYFSDIGLAAALIQKKEKVTRDDLVTTFTIQELLVLTLVIIGFLFSGFVANFYDLDTPGTRLFQVLLISFFLSSLKTIPSVILERDLEFKKVVIPQIAEALVFNSLAVILVAAGFGITSFTFAVLARGLVGVTLIYIIAPWKPGIGIYKKSAKKLVSFGLPFQANSLLALVKDDFLIIILGKILTLTEVGFIGFAQKWAFMPLRLIMDKVIRVTFPAFSRLQERKDLLGPAIEKVLFSVAFFLFPTITGLVIVAPYAVHIIPKYGKWEQALLLLSFFAINAVFSSISTPLTNFLNALGKIKTTLRLMIFWTISTWLLTFILIRFYGYLGVAMASAIISTSVVIVVYITRKYVEFNVFRAITVPFLGSIVMGIVLYLTLPLFVNNIWTLILSIILGGVLYFGTALLIGRKLVINDLKTILGHLK